MTMPGLMDIRSIDDYDSWKECDDAGLVLDLLESSMDDKYRRTFEVFMCKWEITDIHNANVSSTIPMKIVDYAGWGW